ncbi:ricin-type beta-trefoil lectin domain protein [Streptomyces sp. NPDC048275]|uniref:ricin-type beta-trefoil lectin domain protein n=1 Tax=Streptomyces sp. NPDC048275 TaxID=3155629 RepID=UPI0033FC4AAF
MPPHPEIRDPDVPDGAPPRFADAFARRPALPRRKLLPDRRAWRVLATASAVVGCAALVVPLMAQIDLLPDKDGKSDTVAVAAPDASATAMPLASPGTIRAGGGSGGSGSNIPPATGSRSLLTGSGTTGGIGTDASGGAPLGGVGGSGSGSGSGADNPSGDPTRSGTQSGSGSADAPAQPTATPAAPLAATPSASTPVVAPGVRIRSYDSGRCIAVSGAQSSTGRDGARLEIRDCDNGAWQKWDMRSDGTMRAFGMCMDLAGASTGNGTAIQLARCNGGWAQKFVLNKAHDLVNSQADKCVDVLDKKTANGTKLQLWSCNGTSNQKWYTS